MKNYILLVLLILTGIVGLHAQWQPDVRLTNDPALSNTSVNNAWCIAASGNITNVVWYDNRNGNYEIYYKRSTDGGISWGTDTRLTNNDSASQFPSVSVSGAVVHIAWYDNRDGNPEIYYKRSTDGGISWGTDTRLTNAVGNSYQPSVTVSGSYVHIVWYDNRVGNSYKIYYKRSTDGGLSWGSDTSLTNSPQPSQIPSVSVSGMVVHVIWHDFRHNFVEEIYYKRSTDGGLSWGADTRLTNNAASSRVPSVAVTASVVNVVWSDERDGNNEIYYKRSSDGGINWGADIRLTNNSGSSVNPSVSAFGSAVHVVWSDTRDTNFEIYYKRSTDGGLNWGADTRLTNNSSVSAYPSVTVSGSVVYLVWYDERDGNREIYYKRDTTGNIVVGVTPVSNEIPNQFSLSQNYPNPFNPSAVIKFQIAGSSSAKIVVFDALGREVKTLVNEQLSQGAYEVEFDGTNLTSGVYYYKLTAGDFTETRKAVLIK